MYIKLDEIAGIMRGPGYEVDTDHQILPGAAQHWYCGQRDRQAQRSAQPYH